MAYDFTNLNGDAGACTSVSESMIDDSLNELHTHEFLGSTKLAEPGDDRHNHRFAGVTSDVILIPGGNHVHIFSVNTDSADHFHQIIGGTGPAVILNPQAPEAFRRHVHIAIGTTTVVDNLQHVYNFATLIENPILPLV
jgi:hypothetical protein